MWSGTLQFLLLNAAFAWKLETQRYADEYGSRKVRCAPCNADLATDRGNEYRGNGADNLGYDWSPKAWGGPAFPGKGPEQRPTRDDDDRRSGRRMQWDNKCVGCLDWVRGVTDRTAGVNEATVTSPTLGVIVRNDKRLPVSWGGEEARTMRWDGFRNGMSWQPEMERRDWSDTEPTFQPRDGTSKGYSGWDSFGKGHYYAPDKNYASRWGYGSPNNEWNGSQSRWTDSRPWDLDERGHQQSIGNPYRDNYIPQGGYPPNRRPPSGDSNHYPQTHRPPATLKPQDLITDKPYYKYPESSLRPSNYPNTQRDPWNYQGGGYNPNQRPFSNWQPERPTQNYIPQNNRPYEPNYPNYNKQPPKGYYTGIITELSNEKFGSNRPYGGSSFPNHPYNNNNNNNNNNYPRPSDNRENYPVQKPYNPSNYDRYPNYNDRDNRYPDNRPNYQNPYDSRPPPSQYPDNSDKYGYNRPFYDKTNRPYDYDDRRENSNRPYYNYDNSNKIYPDFNDRPSRYPGDRYQPNNNNFYENNNQRPETRPDYSTRRPEDQNSNSWNYGDRDRDRDNSFKDGIYRRAGGSYPPYKGGQYYTAKFQGSDTTPAEPNSHEPHSTTEPSEQKK